MDKNFILLSILASVLMGSSFGLFSINDSFADDNLSVSTKDSEAYQKQSDKRDEQKEKDEERKLKAQEKDEERKLKAQEKDEERKLKAQEQLKKLEERKIKLESDRKNLEEKLSKKINKYEEKLKEIKEKYQYEIESGYTGNVDKYSAKIEKSEDKFTKKSEDIRKKLQEKHEKLDSRTQKILEKINNGDYLGEKFSSSNSIEMYEMTFDSVIATNIHDKTNTSFLNGTMSFKTFDKGKSNLKLELDQCDIVLDNVPFSCGFGKARTTSSGDSASKDSLVILAFLEDAVLEEVHSTLKISLNANSPIGDIQGSSQVSILAPQSKISGMWFLDGTGTLTKTISSSDDTIDEKIDDPEDNEISIELPEEVGLTGN
jgi:myosin heavy subunit